MSRISEGDIVYGARGYRLMSRRMVAAVLSLPERNCFSKGVFSWVGFQTSRQGGLNKKNVERVAGETKWSFWKLFVCSIDGIVAFSTVPLALASLLGTLLAVIGLGLTVWIIIRSMIWGDPVVGWPSMICVILIVGGMLLLSSDILGQYLAKTYIETKRRPLYVIKESK